jgi:two-component system sensor histidine kinase EvgS
MRKTMYCVMSKNQISQTVTPAVASRPRPPNYPRRILVVDQNDDFRLLCADALTGPGCRVDVAEDGATAWRALQAHHYSLLITENKLPNLFGDELIRKLRSAHMKVPVVIIAGGLSALEPAQNSPCHCAATLFKPIALDTLLPKLIPPENLCPLVISRPVFTTPGANAVPSLLFDSPSRCM